MWQKTLRPTLHDRSGTLIGLGKTPAQNCAIYLPYCSLFKQLAAGLAVLFLGILSVGTALFRLEVRDDRTFSEIRRAVIANYSRYIFKNQEVSLDSISWNIQQQCFDSRCLAFVRFAIPQGYECLTFVI